MKCKISLAKFDFNKNIKQRNVDVEVKVPDFMKRMNKM